MTVLSPTNATATGSREESMEIIQDFLRRLVTMTDWELRRAASLLASEKFRGDKKYKWKGHRKFNDIADPEVQVNYLSALEATGRYASAADAAGCNPYIVQVYRRETPSFQEKCNLALEYYRDEIIIEARRRSVDGYQVPIVGGRNKDEIVAWETRYSDRLLELFLKRGANEEFSDKVQVQVDGQPIREQMDLRSLSSRARAKLRELLNIIKEDEEERLIAQRNVIDVPTSTE